MRAHGGFDEQFFFNFEETDLCKRIWDSGHPILFTPDATLIHLGGQSTRRAPARFEVEKCRNRYRYYYKYFGAEGARRCRTAFLAHIRARRFGFALKGLFSRNDTVKTRLKMYRILEEWNSKVDPVAFVEKGIEPSVSLE